MVHLVAGTRLEDREHGGIEPRAERVGPERAGADGDERRQRAEGEKEPVH